MRFRKLRSLCMCFSLCLGATLLPVQELDAQLPTCDVVDCSGGCYEVSWPAGWPSGTATCDEETDPSGMVIKTRSWFQSPAPAFVSCEGMGSGFYCNAYPWGEGLMYLWSSTGDIYLPYNDDLSSSVAAFSCLGMGGPSTVTVTVVSPFGVAATSSMNVGRCRP